ncbi:hypothetical protein TB2_034103 [Malus domestica]
MSYDDVEMEDMEWNEELQAYTCSLDITVVYNIEDFLDKKSSKPIEPPRQQPITLQFALGKGCPKVMVETDYITSFSVAAAKKLIDSVAFCSPHLVGKGFVVVVVVLPFALARKCWTLFLPIQVKMALPGGRKVGGRILRTFCEILR